MAEEGKSSSGVRVCVTGGAGFIGSWLVKKLLERGYTVHATLRDTGARGVLLRLMAPRSDPPRRVGESAKKLKERRLVADRLLCVVARFRYLIPIRLVAAGDEEKAGLLRRLVPAAAERLRLFEADLFDAATFAPAIAGCRFVFLVATPYGLEAASSKYKTTAEAAVAAARVILRQCEESQTVKRVIHTASIASASPLKEGGAGAGYKDFISESCWTPLNVDYPLRSAHFDEYILSKLQSERELLSYNAGERPAFEVVTLPLGLVAGDTVLGRAPETLEHAVSPVSRNGPSFAFLRLLQRLLGSLPLVHVDDACDALIFCADQPSVAGRFLCAAAYPTIHNVAAHFASRFPNLDVLRE
ncbi:hypothetical protein PAHAL_4G064700 [Panicum hallii]|nr:hypothetical protein PAHAL_4G064700 [Panicum hallii]